MARPPKVTWDRLREKIEAGHGFGHGEDYRSMIEIKRWNPSPVSVQVRKPVPPYRRVCHFLSRSEWLLALLFSWLGALIREQYPLWPWPHPHPNYGLNPDLDSTLPWSKGMEDVCACAGIRHGTFPGTRIPYIWTMDLVLTIPRGQGERPGCALVCIKPIGSERCLFIDPLDRGAEKLEAERRYAKSLRVPYFVSDRTLFPGDLLGQLEFLSSAAVLPESHPWWPTLQRFLDTHGPELASQPPLAWIERLQKDFRATKEQADFLIQHCLWNQVIDADLSRYVDFTKCPIPGGRQLRVDLRRRNFEDRQ